MKKINGARDFAKYVDDRPGDGVFRVDREVYLDEEILEAEFESIFEGNWIYLCHESQVREPGDYFATHMGRQPVFVVRRANGQIGGFLNACGHRGSPLTSKKAGNFEATIGCPLHGWQFDTDGRCVAITLQATGGLDRDLDKSCFDLKSIARLDSYRGFVFGSLNPDVADLADHLGSVTKFIDMYVAPAPRELEIVAGASTHLQNCNWKVLHENGPDAYHGPTVHRNFFDTMAYRDRQDNGGGLRATDAAQRLVAKRKSGSYALKNGHVAFWMERPNPELYAIYGDRDRVRTDYPEEIARWMLDRGRHVTLFPNMLFNELSNSTMLRTYRPLGVDRTEVSVWCVAPVGESQEMREARARRFEDFFMPSGLATADDVVMIERAHGAAEGRQARWNNNMFRGAATAIRGPDDAARELGIEPEWSSEGADHEVGLQSIYRHWVKVLSGDEEARHG